MLDIDRRMLMVAGRTVPLTPIQIAVYASFLREKTARCSRPGQPQCGDCRDCFLALNDMWSRDYTDQLGRDYERMYGKRSGRTERFLESWRTREMDSQILRQHISKINAAIRSIFHEGNTASQVRVQSLRSYGRTRYGVTLDKGRIHVETLPPTHLDTAPASG